MSKVIAGSATPLSVTLITKRSSYTARRMDDKNISVTVRDSFHCDNPFKKIPIIRSFWSYFSDFGFFFVFFVMLVDWFMFKFQGQLTQPRSPMQIVLLLIYDVVILFFSLWYVSKSRKNHAAEHMVINALDAGVDVSDMENVRQQSTFNKHCGTTLVICILVFMPVLFLTKSIFLTILLGIELDMMITNKELPIFKFFQRLTTKKPDDDNLVLAITAAMAIDHVEKLEE